MLKIFIILNKRGMQRKKGRENTCTAKMNGLGGGEKLRNDTR